MRTLLAVTMLFSMFLSGCGSSEPQPIEGRDTAQEISAEEESAERELVNPRNK